jgi:GGDEF domain-containing protein
MIQDRLTKSDLYTQEIIWALLFHEIARVERYAVPLTLLRLKAGSPQSSKLEGADGIKKIVTHVLKANLRLVDMAGLYQNDYLIILPVTDDTGARIVAQRLITTLYNIHPYRYGKTLEITPFIGITTLLPKNQASVEEFVEQATAALREAYMRSPGSVFSYADVASVIPDPQPEPDTPTPQ